MVAMVSCGSVTRTPSTHFSAGVPVMAPTARHLLDPFFASVRTLEIDQDHEIVAQGDEAGYCFLVVSGCVRTVQLLEDGRRHIGAFLFSGDVFGWETLHSHDFGAEAVTPVVLRRFRADAIDDRAADDRLFALKLRQYITQQARITREKLVLLARKTASERIASFLLEMHDRADDDIRGVVNLPMARGDIADYLGLTIETVSRGLTELRRLGMIKVDRARITILNAQALLTSASNKIH